MLLFHVKIEISAFKVDIFVFQLERDIYFFQRTKFHKSCFGQFELMSVDHSARPENRIGIGISFRFSLTGRCVVCSH